MFEMSEFSEAKQHYVVHIVQERITDGRSCPFYNLDGAVILKCSV